MHMETVTAAKRFKTTNEQVCRTCAKPLVKQHLDGAGSPFAPEYVRLLEIENEIDMRTKECAGCGGLCYHSLRDKTPLNDEMGLCKQCGGFHLRHRPKYLPLEGPGGELILRDLRQQRLTRLWSCSDCGFGGITPEFRAERQALHRKVASNTLNTKIPIRKRVSPCESVGLARLGRGLEQMETEHKLGFLWLATQ